MSGEWFIGSHNDWKMYLCEVCASNLLKNERKIGGPGMAVDIDELSFPKENITEEEFFKIKVFGGIFSETRDCFMYAIPDQTKQTLTETIKTCIEKGLKIISDKWKVYQDIHKLEGYFFEHESMNHSENFVNPTIGAHTQNIENLWASAKRCNKRENGIAWQMLASYLYGFLWHQRYQDLFSIGLYS